MAAVLLVTGASADLVSATGGAEAAILQAAEMGLALVVPADWLLPFESDGAQTDLSGVDVVARARLEATAARLRASRHRRSTPPAAPGFRTAPKRDPSA